MVGKNPEEIAGGGVRLHIHVWSPAILYLMVSWYLTLCVGVMGCFHFLRTWCLEYHTEQPCVGESEF